MLGLLPPGIEQHDNRERDRENRPGALMWVASSGIGGGCRPGASAGAAKQYDGQPPCYYFGSIYRWPRRFYLSHMHQQLHWAGAQGIGAISLPPRRGSEPAIKLVT